MRLGIDIDGTIKDTQHMVLDIYNRELGKNMQIEDLIGYDDIAFGDLPKEEEETMWQRWAEEIFRFGKPFPDAAAVLQQRVKDGDEIFFITARDNLSYVKSLTEEWLSKHGFPYNGDNLYIGIREKGLLAKELKIDLFFEDAPFHLDNLIVHNIDMVIVDALYNRRYPSHYKRLKSWSDFK